VELLPVKINFVNSIGAFNAAVGLGPHIITCSWGSSTNGPLSAADQALAAAVAAAVAANIIVVFSAGNGHAGFPGQHPDVISAGGVFMDRDESLRASNYASGFMSQIYPGRRVPDLSGLVGMRPKAIYITLPVQPGDEIDSLPWNHVSGRGLQGGVHPNGDETANNDGWGGFSGTSAAAPQLAGLPLCANKPAPL
jgi:subtilisin family serine protease